MTSRGSTSIVQAESRIVQQQSLETYKTRPERQYIFRVDPNSGEPDSYRPAAPCKD
jgi:hypothetical protein